MALAQVKHALKDERVSRDGTRVRKLDTSLSFELTLAATLSLADVKPTNWEMCAFC